MIKAECPDCLGSVEIPEDAIDGEIVGCPDCGMNFEVVLKDGDGIELRPAEIEGEDWGE